MIHNLLNEIKGNMPVLFSSEGYFCEGYVDKNWEFKMSIGKIILTRDDLSLFRKSSISLTEMGTSINEINEGFKVPLPKIKKVFTLKISKSFFIIIQTIDEHIFSITMANSKNSGMYEATHLTELINTTILESVNLKKMVSNQNYQLRKKPEITHCRYCGEKIKSKVNFCRYCGMKQD